MKILGTIVVTLALTICRNIGLLVVVPAAVLSWAVLVLPLLAARSVLDLGLKLNVAYFIRYGIQLLDASLSRTVGRPVMAGAHEPWPWVEPPIGVNATKWRYLL